MQNPALDKAKVDWHADGNYVSMKSELRYKWLTISAGVLVAVLIALTLWAKTGEPRLPKVENPDTISIVISPLAKAVKIVRTVVL